MAYKRNPMRSERIAALSRYIIADSLNPAMTAATQWFERTLDDSANKRISVAEAFLAADAVLSLVINVVDGLVVNTAVIDRDLRRELPFMATENIMMDCVKRGGTGRSSMSGSVPILWPPPVVSNRRMGSTICSSGSRGDPAFGLTLPELETVLDPPVMSAALPNRRRSSSGKRLRRYWKNTGRFGCDGGNPGVIVWPPDSRKGIRDNHARLYPRSTGPFVTRKGMAIGQIPDDHLRIFICSCL